MKIQELICKGIEILKEAQVEEYSIKAKLLLSYVLEVEKNYLLTHSEEVVSVEKKNKYLKYLDEIIEGKPLQYITQKQEFMGNTFYVDKNVLIPQPDTEILVEEVLKCIEKIYEGKKLKVLDLCTGSGAIAISISKILKEKVEIYASDISEKALEVAKKNAKLNDVKINYILSDMFDKINDMKFDIIVSNPPYIEKNVIKRLSKEVQNEPIIALDGGEEGIDFYRNISNEADKYLKETGYIFLEIGYDQKEKVIDLFKNREAYSNIESKKDLGGNDRVISIKYNKKLGEK